VAAFEAGDVNYIDWPPVTDVARLQGADVTAEVAVGNFHTSWGLSHFEGKPTADPRVRLAVQHAFDAQVVSESIYSGLVDPMEGQPLTAFDFGYNPAISRYPFDPDLARTMMRDAGFPDGFKGTITTLTGDVLRNAVELAFVDFLGDIGIDLEFRPVDIGAWRSGLYGEETRADFFHYPFNGGGIFEASSSLAWLLSTTSAPWYDNPAFDTAVRSADQTMDTGERERLYQEAGQLAHDDPPIAWVTLAPVFHMWHPSEFGVVSGGQPQIYYDSTVAV
jgi:peptide/nickel transport system substrate-binding protein